MKRTQSVSRKSWQRALPLIVLLLFSILVASVAIWLGGSLGQDPDAYAQLAVTLANTGTFGIVDDEAIVHPTAYRPPLYPWLLSWFVIDGRLSILGVALLHLAILSLLSITVWDIARRLQINWPWLPAVLVCIDPLVLRATQQVMTELLATTLATVAWWLWLIVWPPSSMTSPAAKATCRHKTQWAALIVLGIVFGLSILARPTAALWVAVFCLCMICTGCSGWKRRLLDGITVGFGVAICVIPWTLRNLSQLQKPVWGTTHGGYTLLLANNPRLYRHFEVNGADRDWQADAFHQAWALRGKVAKDNLLKDDFWLGKPTSSTKDDEFNASRLIVYSLGELQDDTLAYEVAEHTISRNPKTFAKSCIYRLGWFWSCWPNAVGKQQAAVVGTWYLSIFVLAVLGLRRAYANSRSFWISWLPSLILMLVLSCVHSVYWSNMRMRCPLMPGIYLLATIAFRAQKETTDVGESRHSTSA